MLENLISNNANDNELDIISVEGQKMKVGEFAKVNGKNGRLKEN